jgi:hypothetical protein
MRWTPCWTLLVLAVWAAALGGDALAGVDATRAQSVQPRQVVFESYNQPG